MFKKIKELLGVVDDSKWGLEIRKKKDFDINKTTGALYGYEPNDEEIDFSTSKLTKEIEYKITSRGTMSEWDYERIDLNDILAEGEFINVEDVGLFAKINGKVDKLANNNILF